MVKCNTCLISITCFSTLGDWSTFRIHCCEIRRVVVIVCGSDAIAIWTFLLISSCVINKVGCSNSLSTAYTVLSKGVWSNEIIILGLNWILLRLYNCDLLVQIDLCRLEDIDLDIEVCNGTSTCI
jgi:hypothetical protein